MDKPESDRYCAASSRRRPSRTSEKVTLSKASRRAKVRWLKPSRRAISAARAIPCGNSGGTAFSTCDRNEPPLVGRRERASSQDAIRRSLREGAALGAGRGFGVFGDGTLFIFG